MISGVSDWQEHKDELPDEFHGIFDELIGRAKSPSGVAATIDYLTSTMTQEEAAEKWDSAQSTIRKNTSTVRELAERDGLEVRSVESTRPAPTRTELIQAVADELGWTEGEEYSLFEDTANGSDAAWIKMAGVRSILDALGERDADAAENGDYGYRSELKQE